MADLPRLADGDDLLAARNRRGETGTAVGDAAEEGGEGIEVTLAIDLEGMLVALRALEAHAQEELADEGHDLVGGAPVAEDRRGAVAPGAPRRRQQAADKLVVGEILPEDIAEEGVEGEGRLDADAVGIGAEEIGPLVGLEVGILRAVQKRRHELFSLRRIGIGKIGAGFVGSGEAADEIEARAPQERALRCLLAGEDVHRGELPPHRLIERRGPGEGGDRGRIDAPRRNDSRAPRGDGADIAGHDRPLAGKGPGADSCIGGIEDGRFAGMPGARGGDVARRAVGVVGGDGQVERFTGGEGTRRGRQRDPLEFRVVGPRLRRPLLDPADKRADILPGRIELLPAPMGNSSCPFLDEEAFQRRGGGEATAAGGGDDRGMIEGGIEGEERQSEAVLPPRLPVAAAAVAAADGEDRLDVSLEEGPVGCGLGAGICGADRRDAAAEQHLPEDARGDGPQQQGRPRGTAVVGGRGHRRSNSPKEPSL